MFCNNCGSPLGPDDKFCNNCGQAANQTPAPGPQPVPQNDFNQNPQNGFNQPPQGNFNQMPQGNPNGFNQMPQGNFNQAPQYNQGVYNQPQQSGGGKSAFIIILVVLILAIAGVVLYLVLNDGKDEEKPPTPNPNNGEEVEPVNVVSSNTMTVDGYQFTIPNGYEKTSDNTGEYLINRTNKLTIDIYTHPNLSFEVYKRSDSITAIKNKLNAINGVTVTKYEIKAVNGIEMLIFYGKNKTSQGTLTFAQAFAPINSYSTGEYLLYSYSSKNAKNFLNDIAEVAKSAKAGTSSFAPGEASEEVEATSPETNIVEEFKDVMTDDVEESE